MERRHAAILGTVGLVVAAVAAVGLVPGVLAQDDGEEGFGTQVATFMQSTAADAEGSVDRGIWEASVDRAGDPGRSVGERSEALRGRMDRLEERTEDLVARRESGDVSTVAYVARASRLRVEMANLEASIDAAASEARRRGVDASELSELRDRAAEMDGPAVAAAARAITDSGGGPGGGPPDGGPPDDGGPGDGAPGGGDGGPPDGGSGDGPPGDGGPGDGGPGDGAPGGGDGGPPDGGSGDGAPGDGGPGDGGSGDGAPGDDGSGDGGSGDGAPGDGGPGDGGP